MHKESREWCGIIGFPKYEVSNDGLIRRITDTGHRLIKTGVTKKGYAKVTIYRDGKPKHFRVHRLVCRAFNGEPPTEKHQVNHEDGDKLNNHHTNLVWSTNKENQDHALETGLVECTYKVLVHNIVERTRALYRSIGHVMSEFALSQSAVDAIIRGYPNAIYNQFYKFELVYTEGSGVVKRGGKTYRVMDYAKGTEFLAHSARLVSHLAKVSETIVRKNIGNNRMVNGFMFKAEDDLSPFIPHTPEAAAISKEDYSNGVHPDWKVVATELRTGKSVEYSSAKEAALSLRLPIAAIYRCLPHGSNEQYKGYSFKRNLTHQ